MKTPPLIVIVLLILSSPIAVPAYSNQRDNVACDLRVRLDPEQGELYGEAALDLANPRAEPLVLLLSSAAKVIKVEAAGRPLPFTHSGGRLDLGQQGNFSRILIRYQAVFAARPPDAPIHNEDPTYGISATITPAGTFLSGAAAWYPLLPDQPMRYQVRIEAPPGYLGVTSGSLIEEGVSESQIYSLWRTDHPLLALSLAAGPYLVTKVRAGGIPIYAYFYPQSQDLADTYLQAAKGYLELYQDLFGPYPFEKFAVVENFFPTGYGFPSWTLLGSSVVRLPFIVETSLGHEIAHSWWGTGVAVDPSQGNWAEGLTTYVADHLYQERTSAVEAVEYRLKTLRDYAALVNEDNDFPLARFGGRDSKASQAVGYGKGAMVFHMLRKRLGETAFWEGLRKLAAAKMFGTASWDDFRRMFEATSGMDLAAFFRQWIDRPGAPVLELREVTAGKRDGQWRVTGNLVQEGKIYDLIVPVRLEGESAAVDRLLPSAQAETPFDFVLPWRPGRLLVDPEYDLFRRLSPEELPPTINGIRGSTNLLVVTADNLSEPAIHAGLTLLAALRQDQAPVVAESLITDAHLKKHDLLFIGWPARRNILPPLPDGLILNDHQVVIDETAINLESADLFAALPHPRQKNLNCALFLPSALGSARIAARKIPHYGKYSYVMFQQGENRLKGTWMQSDSAIIHNFPKEEHHE
jgi:hypothetical protein